MSAAIISFWSAHAVAIIAGAWWLAAQLRAVCLPPTATGIKGVALKVADAVLLAQHNSTANTPKP